MSVSEILENPTLKKIIYSFLALVLVYLATLFMKKAINRLIASTDNKYKARKASNLLGYVLFVTAIIFIYSDQLGNLGVALGVTGAGIAFALQEVILSFAGWIYIVFTASVSVGQRIKVGELKGDVIDIGMLSSTLMEIGDWVKGDLYNGRMVNISNSFVFKERIQNYSAEYPFLWDEITIPLRHESDYALARKVFESIADDICSEFANQSESQWKRMTNKFRIEEAIVRPMVSMEFDENWITFTVRYIVDYKRRRFTKDAIYTAILDAINKSDGQLKIATAAMEISRAK